MSAASPEAEQTDLIRRMAQTLTADAAEHGADLADPAVRRGFEAGLTVALSLVVSAHETGKTDDASSSVLEDLLATAVVSLRSEHDGKR